MIVELSTRIRELRLEKRLRQDQLAALVGVEKSSISMYENDLRRPSFETLVRLSEVFDVSTDYLLGRTNNRALDLSGLTAAEAAMITEFVSSMAAKNRKLEEYQK